MGVWVYVCDGDIISCIIFLKVGSIKCVIYLKEVYFEFVKFWKFNGLIYFVYLIKLVSNFSFGIIDIIFRFCIN